MRTVSNKPKLHSDNQKIMEQKDVCFEQPSEHKTLQFSSAVHCSQTILYNQLTFNINTTYIQHSNLAVQYTVHRPQQCSTLYTALRGAVHCTQTISINQLTFNITSNMHRRLLKYRLFVPHIYGFHINFVKEILLILFLFKYDKDWRKNGKFQTCF